MISESDCNFLMSEQLWGVWINISRAILFSFNSEFDFLSNIILKLLSF